MNSCKYLEKDKAAKVLNEICLLNRQKLNQESFENQKIILPSKCFLGQTYIWKINCNEDCDTQDPVLFIDFSIGWNYILLHIILNLLWWFRSKK